ncbi:MAG: MATE family efflux transporter [Deltaproteobacteria bacterium]|nr:MATE family efflux transporter [Deltaproteobacteria bacterium]
MKRILSHTAEITGEAPLVRVAVTLALPAMGMMYLIASFNFIDTEFAGQLGAAALAGISTGAFVYWAMIGLGNLVSIGTGAVVARRIGEGKREEPSAWPTRACLRPYWFRSCLRWCSG